jgi:hypothetical protein
MIVGSKVTATKELRYNSTQYNQRNGEFVQCRPKRQKARVAVITAIYGAYEASCKAHARQSLEADFICFTDNLQGLNVADGWLADTVPYHLASLREEFDHNYIDDRNAFHNNLHPFNVAKYYKTAFHHIPRLQSTYEMIIWTDGSLQITNPKLLEIISQIFKTNSYSVDQQTFLPLTITFENKRDQSLWNEVSLASQLGRYNSKVFGGHYQPYQDILGQYKSYLSAGYDESYFRSGCTLINPCASIGTNATITDQDEAACNATHETPVFLRQRCSRSQYGTWITSFLPFRLKCPTNNGISETDSCYKSTAAFLEKWRSHIRLYTTEDQVSFSFLCQTEREFPISLPNSLYRIYGNALANTLFIKFDHGN